MDTRYFMRDEAGPTELQVITEKKDLGVCFTDDLKPERQCMVVAAKVRRIVGLCVDTSAGLTKMIFY